MRATAPERPDETQELLGARACYGKTLPAHVCDWQRAAPRLAGFQQATPPAMAHSCVLACEPYALWSGADIVLISLVTWALHGQRLDAPALLGMGLIAAGAVVINVYSKVAPH